MIMYAHINGIAPSERAEPTLTLPVVSLFINVIVAVVNDHGSKALHYVDAYALYGKYSSFVSITYRFYWYMAARGWIKQTCTH